MNRIRGVFFIQISRLSNDRLPPDAINHALNEIHQGVYTDALA